MFRLFSYIKFWFSSTNQHGIHSPFVYGFVTKGLYVKAPKNPDYRDFFREIKLNPKEEKILQKILVYFKVELNKKASKSETYCLDELCNVLYYNNLKIINKDAFTQEQMIIVRGIHNDKQSEQNWGKFIQNEAATVTIDLFYFGLIFFRKEQRKEHFVIRP